MKAQNRSVHATQKWPIRRWVRIAHLWAGVGLGVWIVILGLTGSALVYQHSLRRAFEPERRIRPRRPALSIEELLSRVHRQRPDLVILDIEGMEYQDSAWELLVRPLDGTKEKHSRWLLVDPGTGEVRGMQTSVSTLMGLLAQLHYNLLSGEIGLRINAFAGGLTIFFAVTGLILWWRGRAKWKNGLRVKLRGKSSRVRNYSLHSAIGFYSSLFLATSGLSGIYFAAPRPFLSTAAILQGTSLSEMHDFLNPPRSVTAPGATDAAADWVVAKARAQFPASRLYEIEIPIQPMDAWQFHFFSHGVFDLGDAELVSVDRRSGTILASHRTADLPGAVRAVIMLRPLHYGTFGGNLTKILWVLFGLTPAFLFVTGILVWRQRVSALTIPTRSVGP
jgi:uncharacterized iron-regulated membrane protein